MTDEPLEQLLRTTFERDAARVPLASREWDPTIRLRRHQAPPPRRSRLSAVAVLVVAVMVGAALAAGLAPNESGGVASQPPEGAETAQPLSTPTTQLSVTPTTQGPPVGLPAPAGDVGGTPTTVVEGPYSYYRFAPDLDLAWIDSGGDPRLCWRTPIEERCIPEPVPAPGEPATVVIPSSAGHAVILVLDTGSGGLPTELTITRANGETYTGPITWDDPQLGIGLFRVDLPAADIGNITIP